MVGMYFFYICNFIIYFHHFFHGRSFPSSLSLYIPIIQYILYILVQYMDRIELFAADELTSECLSINDGEIVPPAPAENIL